MALPQPAPSPGIRSPASTPRWQALAKLEALQEEVDAALARRKSNSSCAARSRRGAAATSCAPASSRCEATNVDDTNAKAYHVLGMALERMGHLHKALVTYERAFQLDPDDPELLINLGLIAWNLKQTRRRGEDVQPLHRPPAPTARSATTIWAASRATWARSKLRSRLCAPPSTACPTNRSCGMRSPPCSPRRAAPRKAWSSTTRRSVSMPNFARLYHNLGYAYAHLGMLDEALAAYDKALEIARRSGRAPGNRAFARICLIGMGRLEEGFARYEVRNNPRFRAYVHHMIKAPQWKGEALAGKRILVVGEQGLGDEFMFANILPDLQRAVGENGKLRSPSIRDWSTLFQRSFPKAESAPMTTAR